MEWRENAFHLPLSALRQKLDSMHKHHVEMGSKGHSNSSSLEQIVAAKNLLENGVIEEITVVIRHAGVTSFLWHTLFAKNRGEKD